MKKKIQEYYKSNFQSSPIELGKGEIDFIIKMECKCDRCDKSIFDMDDFPEILRQDCRLLCEECYSDEYQVICPVCEDYYDVLNGKSEYEVITEQESRDYNKTPGIYHNEKLIVPIRINFFKKIDCGDNCCEVFSDPICPECVEKFIRKTNYLKSNNVPCILLKRYEKDSLFKDYTPENLHLSRQWIIHRRITCRGLIERGNHIDEYGKKGKQLNR